MSTFKCACGQTEAKLSGDPFNNAACYCHSCVASGRFIDEKEGNGTTQLNEHGGYVMSMYSPNQVEFTSKPENGFASVKVGEKGKNLRCYAKCCNTPAYFLIGTKVILLNTNCIYNQDGSKYEPNPQVTHYMKKYAFEDSSPPDSTYNMVPVGQVVPLLGRMLNPFAPKVTDEDLILDKETAQVVPITWE